MKNIIKTKLILFTLTFAFSFQATAKIYTWIDSNGQTHYSATPPKGSNTSKEISIKNSTITLEKKVLSKQRFSENKKVPIPLKEQVKNLPIFTKLQCQKALQGMPDLTKAMGTKRPKGEAKKIKNILNLIDITVTFKDIPTCASNYQQNPKHKKFTNCIADNNSFDALTCIASLSVTKKLTPLNSNAKKQCYKAIKIDQSIILGLHSTLKEKLKKGELSKEEYLSQRRPLTAQLKLVESLSLPTCIDNYNENRKNQEFIDCYAGSFGLKNCLNDLQDIDAFGETPKTLIKISKKY